MDTEKRTDKQVGDAAAFRDTEITSAPPEEVTDHNNGNREEIVHVTSYKNMQTNRVSIDIVVRFHTLTATIDDENGDDLKSMENVNLIEEFSYTPEYNDEDEQDSTPHTDEEDDGGDEEFGHFLLFDAWLFCNFIFIMC